MNSIITLPKLTAYLSENTGLAADECAKFVEEFTQVITEALRHDNVAKIKGIGTFTKETADEKVIIGFIPEKELADAVNGPFASFEEVVLADGLSEEELEAADQLIPREDPSQPQPLEREEEAPIGPDLPDKEEDTLLPEIPAKEEDSPLPEIPAKEETAPQAEQPQASSSVTLDKEEEMEPQPFFMPISNDEPEDAPKSHIQWFTAAVCFAAGILIGLGLGYFGHDYIQGRGASNPGLATNVIPISDTSANAVLTVDPVADDTIAAPTDSTIDIDLRAATEGVLEHSVDTAAQISPSKPDTSAPKPKAKPVYGSVPPGGALSSLARKHYGHSEYWVYIYLANTDKIKNPDNVSPSLKLLLPDKSSFEVSKTDRKANIADAKKKASEIMNRRRR